MARPLIEVFIADIDQCCRYCILLCVVHYRLASAFSRSNQPKPASAYEHVIEILGILDLREYLAK